MAKLQEELETMKPLLEEAVQESISTMKQIEVDTKVAEETKELVMKEEAAATVKAQETQAIAGTMSCLVHRKLGHCKALHCIGHRT